VAGQPVGGVSVVLDAGRRVSGRVTFEGGAPADLSSARLTAMLRLVTPPAAPLGPPAAMGAFVRPDGTFTITGVFPGIYTMRGSGGAGFVAKSATIAGADALDFPVEIGNSDIADVLVTLEPQRTPSEVSGVVRAGDGSAAPESTVVIFSADTRFWVAGGRRHFVVRPGTDGRYVVTGLPEGDYRAIALPDVEPGAQYDPATLRSWLGRSTAVRVTNGGKITQDLVAVVPK
jgi:hypothetical protein